MWPNEPGKWPPNIATKPSAESNAEDQTTKELFALAVKTNNDLDNLASFRVDYAVCLKC